MGSLVMAQPVFVRLQNTKQYSAYKKRILNRRRTDQNTFKAGPAGDSDAQRNIKDFLEETEKRPFAASFKAESRNKKRGKQCGEYLLPGAYEHGDFIEELRARPATYAFKSSGRLRKLAWERADTELNRFPVPGQYETTTPPVKQQTVASSMFKSKTVRFN